MGTLAVVGVGPGLGMSIAHRFGREGHRVALVSRTDARHAGYIASLARAGIEAAPFVADVRDRAQVAAANPQALGGGQPPTLDPDDIADVAWELHTKRDRAEAIFNALT